MATTNSHESGPTGVNPDAVKAGHEPDEFQVKPILSVPLAVGVTFVIAFVVTTAVFAYFVFGRAKNPMAHPAAVKQNERPLNDQTTEIGRRGSTPGYTPTTDQPRPEPNQPMTNGGLSITQFPLSERDGSSPLIHPEDNRPERVAALSREYRWAEDQKSIARIPVQDAIALATGAKAKAWLPAPPNTKNAARVDTARKASTSSGGFGDLPPGTRELGGTK